MGLLGYSYLKLGLVSFVGRGPRIYLTNLFGNEQVFCVHPVWPVWSSCLSDRYLHHPFLPAGYYTYRNMYNKCVGVKDSTQRMAHALNLEGGIKGCLGHLTKSVQRKTTVGLGAAAWKLSSKTATCALSRFFLTSFQLQPLPSMKAQKKNNSLNSPPVL